MTSSIRFRNSGRKERLSSSVTFSFIFVYVTASSRAAMNPIPTPLAMSRVPRFEVMMMIVFLKSTWWPCASVRWPSSRICSSVLNTSGCAFSISSKSTTLNGLRRTASVSWPPSS